MALQQDCVFCFENPEAGNGFVEAERVIGRGFESWLLILQPEIQRRNTAIQAAGLLVVRRHIALISDLTPEEMGELAAILPDAAQQLCDAVGTEYTDQYRVGANQGDKVGQTVDHLHFHVLPRSATDPDWERNGIIGAFTALAEVRAAADEPA